MGKSSSNSMKELCIEISENSVGLEVEYDSLKKHMTRNSRLYMKEGWRKNFCLLKRWRML